jgi:DNA-binding GntR family transcriptional regulator
MEIHLPDDKIHEWAICQNVAKRIAADLAANINKGVLDRRSDLPHSASLADHYDVSIRTVARAKAILANHGMIEKAGGRYYLALRPCTKEKG